MKNEQTNDRCWTLVPIQEKKQIEGGNIVMKKRMATMALALTLAVSMIVSAETIPAKAAVAAAPDKLEGLLCRGTVYV